MSELSENETIFAIADQEVTVTLSTHELVALGCAASLYPQIVDGGLVLDPGDEFFSVFESAMEKLDNVLQPLLPIDIDEAEGEEFPSTI